MSAGFIIIVLCVYLDFVVVILDFIEHIIVTGDGRHFRGPYFSARAVRG